MVDLRERILLYGPPGSGKSYSALSIAQRYSKSQFWVLDTDQAWGRMMSGQFSELENVHVFECDRWEKYISALKEIKPQAKSSDWLVIDFISSAWDEVQSYFVEEVFGEGIDSYFLKQRKAMDKKDKNLDALAGWIDWPVIKKLYQGFIHQIRKDFSSCHLLATASIKAIQEREKDPGKLSFSPYGGYPAGEKNLPYQFHTVLAMNQPRSGKWELSSYKDRERPLLDHAELTDFAKDYVLKVAKLKR